MRFMYCVPINSDETLPEPLLNIHSDILAETVMGLEKAMRSSFFKFCAMSGTKLALIFYHTCVHKFIIYNCKV